MDNPVPHKAVIAIDSFKGHLTAEEAAQAAGTMIKSRFPDIETDIIPSSDGGEGFSAIVTKALGGTTVTTAAHDPLGREIQASYGLCGGIAVIECASATGLTLLSPDELSPMTATSRGTGELIADAIRKGSRDIYVGLGGSATVDGGWGIIEALADAWEQSAGSSDSNGLAGLDGIDGLATDPAGRPDGRSTIERARRFTEGCRFTAICDVEATFCGESGAAAVYGPQKGATPEQVPVLDEKLRRLGETYRTVLGRDVLTQKGTGAAGGMAGAIWAVLGGEIRPGADAVLDILKFEEHLEGAEIVITGEGKLDAQTFQGKLPYTVARRAKTFNPQIKVIAYVGISDYEEALPPFDELIKRG